MVLFSGRFAVKVLPFIALHNTSTESVDCPSKGLRTIKSYRIYK